MNTFDKIDETYVQKNGVQALANRPNQPSQYGQGGLNAAQLKAHFDRLATHIINKYNALVEALADPDIAASYIAWEKDGNNVTSLADFFASVSDGELANKLMVEEGGNTLAESLEILEGYIETLLIKIANGTLAKEMKVIVTDSDEIDTDSVVGRFVSILGDIASLKTSINNLIATIASVQSDYLSKSAQTGQELAGNIKTPQVSADKAVIGNIELSGGITSTDKTKQSKFGVLDADTFTATTGSFASNISAEGTVSGDIGNFGDLDVSGTSNFGSDVFVYGDLLVSGKSYAIDSEALTVQDNIVVVNAQTQINNENSVPFANSGIVINTGKIKDGAYEAYGILYQPNGNDAVYIGKGKLIYEDADSSDDTEYDARTATFVFDEGEAIPLAARSGAFNEGDIPLWDAEKNAFKSSGIGLDEVGGGITEWDYEITEPSQFTTENLATMSGAVIVNCDILVVNGASVPITVSVPESVKVLNFNGHKVDVDLYGHSECRLMNAHFVVGGNYEAGYEQYVSGFGSVEFCRGAGVYFNCDRIAHSDIWRASGCHFITDVQTHPYEYEDTVFSNCTNITNVRVSDIYNDDAESNVEFDSCSYISNVSFVGDRDGVIKYYNCTYVDALTCYGYRAFYYDDEAESDYQSDATYGVPYIDANGIVSFLTNAEGGSYGS